ncbi:MAG: MFS transporter [Kofleriaceae bacterium]
MVSEAKPAQRAVTLAVIVAALGYFVDIYDLILFGTVRKASLVELGYAGNELTDKGLLLFNMQMGGLIVGGILWGVLGDKRGRLSVLFGSIITYSLANLANGMVGSIESYAVCRLVAGIGLAGELGAGITLVSELTDKRRRGIATAIVAGVGICGGIAAGIIGGGMPALWEGAYWRHAYYIGGGMGIALLALRIGVTESGMFAKVAASSAARGNFFQLFTRGRFVRYLGLIAVGVPVWYVIGILVTFGDRVGGSLGLHPEPRPATALMFAYAGCAAGDVISGLVSQWLGSRRRALAWFIGATAAGVVLYFTVGPTSSVAFYACCTLVGFTAGYWAVFVTSAAEQFGTNLRATVATTTPNFVRGSAVLLAIGFQALQDPLGPAGAAAAVGVVSIGVAIAGLISLRETFGVDLDFTEDG